MNRSYPSEKEEKVSFLEGTLNMEWLSMVCPPFSQLLEGSVWFHLFFILIRHTLDAQKYLGDE